jgi:hypothetical protein
MNYFRGIRIIESIACVEPGEPIAVRRTWRERLFSRPWRPLEATKMVTPMLPSAQAYWINAHTVVMHPEMAWRLKDTLQDGDSLDAR